MKPTIPPTGIARLDAFLAEGYGAIRGMSSHFAAGICGHLMRRQSELGIGGDLAEIGTFEGRFFIALAMALQPGERGLGIDVFNWPSEKVLDLFEQHCRDAGLDPAAWQAWKATTADMTGADLSEKLEGRQVRFFHIDGEHSETALAHDLELATAVMHPQGLICLDDMLHPGYPTLIVTVMAYLTRHPEMRVLCVIDREDIVAAAKFVLCRADAVPLYEDDLMASFPQYHYTLGAEFVSHWCVVLTPAPRLAIVD